MSEAIATLHRALTDKRLLGLGAPSWLTWRSVLKAAYTEPLSAEERAAFAKVSGGRQPPTRKVKELAAVISRRAGKGRAAGALATYESALVDHSARLAPGERGCVAVISPSRAQAKIVQDYALGFFEASPVLRDEVAEVTADEIRLHNGNAIITLASDYRTLRGRTLLLAVLDEASFLRDELSSTPDIEAVRALAPGLLTVGGMLCVLSSPYRRAGLLFQRYRDFFGKNGDDVLCVGGPSLAFNPTLDTKAIEAARAADPQAAISEWDGEFRSDLLQFLDDASIDSAIDHGRPLELPPRENVRYHSFCDMSGGGPAASTITIGHREGERFIADAVRGRHGDPHAAGREFAALSKQYNRCSTIFGDNYSKEWVAGFYRSVGGLEYRQSPLPRSELYLEGLPTFTRGLINIPSLPILLRELRLLERRTSRSGKDSVSKGPGSFDDHVNSLFGSMYVAAKAAAEPKVIIPPLTELDAPARLSTAQQYLRWRAAGGGFFDPIGGPTLGPSPGGPGSRREW